MKTSDYFFKILRNRKSFNMPALLIAAHPDDEVIGAGSILNRFEQLRIVHVTGGAPDNNYDAFRLGFNSKDEYQNARISEALNAADAAGIHRKNYFNLLFPDQQLIYNIKELISEILKLVFNFKPKVILTHAYEGGHPDHDSIAFAVARVRTQLMLSGYDLPDVIEMGLYHGENGMMNTNSFIEQYRYPYVKLFLNEEDRVLKHNLISKYKSQADVLNCFKLNKEEYRAAPEYNFMAPPHSGKLFYDNFDWGASSSRWREIIKNYLQQVGAAA